MTESTIIYTHTDEAPALATYSLPAHGPGLRRHRPASTVETRDISLAGRIIAAFPEYLDEDQRIDDALAELGALAQTPEANIIKLPNVSASSPQLKAAIAELQATGLRRCRTTPTTRRPTRSATSGPATTRCMGSAVNPVLRQGNSDRRAPASVKNYAQAHPHRMGAWSPDSKTNVAHMDGGDFRSTERSAVMDRAGIAAHRAGGRGRRPPRCCGTRCRCWPARWSTPRSCGWPPSTRSSTAQIARAKAEGVLFSVHLKATMMKISDPIIFGHVVRAFFPATFAALRRRAGRRRAQPERRPGRHLRRPGRAARRAAPSGRRSRPSWPTGPTLAMVDSDRGITNLHVPSDVIVDASMPAMIRTSGHMWGPDGKEADTLAVIPDSSYAGVYQVVIDDCRGPRRLRPGHHGVGPQRRPDGPGGRGVRQPRQDLRDPRRRHGAGGRRRAAGSCSSSRWRPATSSACARPRTCPSATGCKLAVKRARATGDPAVFWLDEGRAHDANLIAKVREYLPEHDTDGLQIEILTPEAGHRASRWSASAGARTPSR